MSMDAIEADEEDDECGCGTALYYIIKLVRTTSDRSFL